VRAWVRALAGAIVLVTASAANAQLYRWTDSSGRVHFTDTPPPPTAKNVQKKPGGAGPSGPGVSNEPYVLQHARKNAPVTLYTAPGCDPCGLARKLLNERGVPFKEVSVADEAGATELKKAAGGSTVPAIIVGASTQMGFEQGVYHALLDAAGYPKSGILPARNPQDRAAVEAKQNPPAPPPLAGPGGAGAPPYAPR
jgi:glutaredoxin